MRPAIGTVTNDASVSDTKTHPYRLSPCRSASTAGRIVATTMISIATSASSSSKPVVSRPRVPAKTARQGGGCRSGALTTTG